MNKNKVNIVFTYCALKNGFIRGKILIVSPMKDFIKKCREILDPKYKKYTDEQIILIHEYLYQIVELNVQMILDYKERTQTGK